EGVNVLAVNYGSPGSCPYPRNLKLPAKWSFSSHTVLKNSEQAPSVPFCYVGLLYLLKKFLVERMLKVKLCSRLKGLFGLNTLVIKFDAYQWMYLIPLGLIVMNAITQAMNMPEEQATGQVPAQGQPSAGAVQRGPSSAVRRR
ncbi:hypothetical protein Gogos_017595, partial [Gossypium gossypioides]|nr:hypothetical protein [Gossypium gossypioides]